MSTARRIAVAAVALLIVAGAGIGGYALGATSVPGADEAIEHRQSSYSVAHRRAATVAYRRARERGYESGLRRGVREGKRRGEAERRRVVEEPVGASQ